MLQYNGGISANAVFYEGPANRESLTYYFTGNLNFNIAGTFNIPLTFTYSNQDFNFPSPFRFNRLSLSPSYRWATAHIGDVTMTFSPYTLNAHQFTGAGVELTPEGPFEISALYGRFLKGTEYNPEAPDALTAYNRLGYGLKAAYRLDDFQVGLIFFKAGDDATSLQNPIPVELGLTPKDNAVVSLESSFTLFQKAQFRVEYAVSGVTEDRNLTAERSSRGPLSFLMDENISTNYYNAFNVTTAYPLGSGTIGLGYERVDPNYRTFGAYFFNNDLENITANLSQTLFKNKLSINVNGGLQHDNLDKQKSAELQRLVGAVNLNYTATDRLSMNGSYSNFRSFTNIRDPFDFINQVDQFENVDTLNFRQITQNANFGLNYTLKNTEKQQHSTNLNLVYQQSDNEQEGELIENGDNAFYNGSFAYSVAFPKEAFNVGLALTTSYNTIGATDNSLILGPTLSLGKQLFQNQVRANFSGSYNTSYTNGDRQSEIVNLRLGSSYVWQKRHNFSLNILSLFRSTTNGNSQDYTVTFGYSYAFSSAKPRQSRSQAGSGPAQRRNPIGFRYRNSTYRGTLAEVSDQLSNVLNSPLFEQQPAFRRAELQVLLQELKKERSKAAYKENALAFLEALYLYEDFEELYDEILWKQILELRAKLRQSTGAEAEVETTSWILSELSKYNSLTEVTRASGRLDVYKSERKNEAFRRHTEWALASEIGAFVRQDLLAFYQSEASRITSRKQEIEDERGDQ